MNYLSVDSRYLQHLHETSAKWISELWSPTPQGATTILASDTADKPPVPKAAPAAGQSSYEAAEPQDYKVLSYFNVSLRHPLAVGIADLIADLCNGSGARSKDPLTSINVIGDKVY